MTDQMTRTERVARAIEPLTDAEAEAALVAVAETFDRLGCCPVAMIDEKADEGVSFSLHFSTERARKLVAALTAIDEERDALREALTKCREFLMSAPLESGYCCCGSPVEGHGFGDGHSPVDELAYAAQGQIDAIDAALARSLSSVSSNHG